MTADELWKGALAETGAGARKGRGKRTKRKRRKDLNRGQIIGEGKLIKQLLCFLRFFFFLCKILQMFYELEASKHF